MNVYDFDGTIYDGDSTIDFYLYCLKNFPQCILALPKAFWGCFLYIIGVIEKAGLKERFFSFLRCIPHLESAVAAFWDSHERKLKKWYIEQKSGTDIIISASPEFLLAPLCHKLGVTLIASAYDGHTGICQGENCYGEENVSRLSQIIDIGAVSAFYSDSYSDNPLASLIANSYMVKKDKIIPWREYKAPKSTRV
jgi:phosphoserine phosphatase